MVCFTHCNASQSGHDFREKMAMAVTSLDTPALIFVSGGVNQLAMTRQRFAVPLKNCTVEGRVISPEVYCC